MDASIADILVNPAAYADQIVNIDGVLLVTDYDREGGQFEQVWLVKQGEPRNRAIRAQPIRSDSTLWHGLSRLNPRHLPGFQIYRVHDAARACVRVHLPAASESEPRVEVLTAAVYRREFTLYVGEKGVRLDQALPARARVRALPEIRGGIARFLGRRAYVYGTLVVRSSPSAQFLLPGKIPFADGLSSALRQLGSGELEADWLADIEYPQSDSEPAPKDRLPESLHLDEHYAIRERLSGLPGINQTIVKPAVVVGKLAARDQEAHFATLTDIEDVYLQNLCYAAGKSLESVTKLKNFDAMADAT